VRARLVAEREPRRRSGAQDGRIALPREPGAPAAVRGVAGGVAAGAQREDDVGPRRRREPLARARRGGRLRLRGRGALAGALSARERAERGEGRERRARGPSGCARQRPTRR